MSDPHELPSPPPAESRVPAGPFRWLVLYTRGLILNQHLRGVTMFYTVIAAMLMMFAGPLFVFDWRKEPWHEHPWSFIVYWLVCAWLTILSALLAVYDMLLLRVRRRRLQRELEKQMLAAEAGDGDPPE